MTMQKNKSYTRFAANIAYIVIYLKNTITFYFYSAIA